MERGIAPHIHAGAVFAAGVGDLAGGPAVGQIEVHAAAAITIITFTALIVLAVEGDRVVVTGCRQRVAVQAEADRLVGDVNGIVQVQIIAQIIADQSVAVGYRQLIVLPAGVFRVGSQGEHCIACPQISVCVHPQLRKAGLFLTFMADLRTLVRAAAEIVAVGR